MRVLVRSAGHGHALRGRRADARRSAGDHDLLAPHLALERAVDELVRVEVALPVVPQAPGVVLQTRHGDAAALERALDLAAVETRWIGDEPQRALRDPDRKSTRLNSSH